MNKLVLVAVSVFGLSLSSCYKDKSKAPLIQESSCDPATVYYQNTIKPILASSCAKAGCHDADTKQSGYDFSTYESAFDASREELMEVLTTSDPEKRMPPAYDTPLAEEKIAQINTWISQGAKNNECSSGSCSTDGVTYSGTIASIISANCASCHSGSTPSGGVSLDSYSGVKVQADNGKLYNAVAQNGQASPMPKGYKLSNCDISKIKAWVDGGAVNN